MSAFASLLPGARAVPMAPASIPTLSAALIEDGHGGAIVTIGTTACPYANAKMAREHLEAMAARGLVRIERKELPVC